MSTTNKAFTLDEATDIAEDFVDLEGTGIYIETDDATLACNVQQVVVAPHPATHREQFITSYKNGTGAEAALQAYNGDEYEVLILGLNADMDDNELIIISIRMYTTAYGIPYRYP